MLPKIEKLLDKYLSCDDDKERHKIINDLIHYQAIGITVNDIQEYITDRMNKLTEVSDLKITLENFDLVDSIIKSHKETTNAAQ